ncbi:hypothetical protein K7X08_023118 [Anisodus acutangulus]|uniref:Uncharacterized protein n=1 Tax=Anisodus acutangulus TaxID=402998 RepID=A0A9Q1MDP4_9SOLA|nr:hypothetical protein K7X08_023118 [Anisodus acutangulus]
MVLRGRKEDPVPDPVVDLRRYFSRFFKNDQSDVGEFQKDHFSRHEICWHHFVFKERICSSELPILCSGYTVFRSHQMIKYFHLFELNQDIKSNSGSNPPNSYITLNSGTCVHKEKKAFECVLSCLYKMFQAKKLTWITALLLEGLAMSSSGPGCRELSNWLYLHFPER